MRNEAHGTSRFIGLTDTEKCPVSPHYTVWNGGSKEKINKKAK